MIERVWRGKDVEYSVDFFPEDHLENLSSSRISIKVKDQIMLDILQNLEEFEIVLYYSDKEDIYKVEKI